MKRCVGYDCIRHAPARINLSQPLGFFNLIVSGTLGLDMHRLQDIMTISISAVIIWQVIALESIKTVDEEVVNWLISQPWIIDVPQIPKVMVSVD
jgi:hypothetical protein